MNSAPASSSPVGDGPEGVSGVIVVGAGPTGLMLAGELALAGVDVVLVERRTNQDLPSARARGLMARTIEVLDQRGIAERFLAVGETMQVHSYAGATLDISDFPTRHPYGLAIGQARVEAILAEWIAGLPVRVFRGRDVVGVEQDDVGVVAELDDGTSMRANYLVGCDGGRSVVRKAVGIGFDGWEATTSYMLAEAEMPDGPELGFKHDEAGRHAISPLPGDDRRVGVLVQELRPQEGLEPSLEELRAGVNRVWGTDFGLHSPTWISRFSDAARQATAYRERRVLIAGDAAHVHSPIGGQGLNTGVQDAVNLGWKLAQVVKGISPERLLDSYHDERHPVGARVLQSTLAQTAAMRPDERTSALRTTLTELAAMDEPRRHLAGMLSALDLHYDLGDGHPLMGRRMPDVDLTTADGPRRLFSLLHGAQPLVLNLGEAGGAFDLGPWCDRVQVVDATTASPWELPVLGAVDAPAAVLVRPDGYVAWVGTLGDADLPAALTTWFGAAAE